MPLAILLVVIAQFFNATVALIDKYIISTRKVPQPSYYAFLVSMLSALSVFIFLFSFVSIPIPEVAIPSFKNIDVPSLVVTLLSLGAGTFFFYALWSLFTALRDADTSDVIPVVGSVSALVAFPFGYYLFDLRLNDNFVFGILLLIIGAFLLSHYRFKRKVLLITVVSGIFFALHFISLKLLFGITHFDNAFFWSRMGIVVAALAIFIPRWEYCKDCSRTTTAGSTAIIVGNKLMAGVASFLILKAVDLSDVSLVQALGGLQFVFLLIFSVTLGHFLPKECGENLVGRHKVQKTIAVSLLVIGFLFLFL